MSDPAFGAGRPEEAVFDFLGFLMRWWPPLFGSAIVGAALAVGMSYLLTPEYEVMAAVRIASVADRPVEAPARVLERVRSGAFKEAVAIAAGLKTPDVGGDGRLFTESLRAQVVERADLIDIRFRVVRADDGARLGSALVARLQAIHGPIGKPSIDRLHDRITDVTAQLARAEAALKRIEQDVSTSDTRNQPRGEFAERIVLADVMLKREEEIRTLREQQQVLREQLSPERTYPTSMLGEPSVSREPVSPKRPIFAVAGALLGFLLAMAATLRLAR